VPDLIGIFGQDQPGDLDLAAWIIEAKLHPFRVSGEEGEVDALSVSVSTQAGCIAGQDFELKCFGHVSPLK
jgi:hypothetical protein